MSHGGLRLAPTGGVSQNHAEHRLVVPAYNEEAAIKELCARLASLMSALDGDAEAILVDDGSSDRTYEVYARGGTGGRAVSPRPTVAELRSPGRSHPASTSPSVTR